MAGAETHGFHSNPTGGYTAVRCAEVASPHRPMRAFLNALEQIKAPLRISTSGRRKRRNMLVFLEYW